MNALAHSFETPEMAAQFPLDRLFLDPLNPRQSPEMLGVRDLAESIKSVGLLQNLVGREYPDGRIGILAGGRRLAAMRYLAEAEGMTFPAVPILLCRDGEDPEIVARVENIAREALSPTDEIVAYRNLIGEQRTVASIASSFGVTEAHVRRRLALADLPDEAITALREGRITLDVAKALTSATDPAKVAMVLDAALTRPLSFDQAYRMLHEGGVSVKDQRVLRIGGIEAYEAAGGSVVRDLFSDQVTLTDEALLDRLVEAAIEDQCAKLRAAGWKRAMPGAGVGWQDMGKELRPVSLLTEAEAEELVALEERERERESFDAFIRRGGTLEEWAFGGDGSDDDYDEGYDDDDGFEDGDDDNEDEDAGDDGQAQGDAEHREAASEPVALTDAERARIAELLAKSEHFSPEQMQVGTVYVRYDWQNNMIVDAAYVRAEDMEDAFEAGVLPRPGQRSEAEATGHGGGEKEAFSQSMIANLRAVELAALQTAMVRDPDLCLALLAYTLSKASVSGVGLRVDPGKNTPDGEMKVSLDERLGSGVRGLGGVDEFTEFRKQPKTAIKQALVYGMARCIDGSTGRTLRETLAETVKPDMREVWTPDADGFFTRIKTADLDALHDLLTAGSPGHAEVAKGWGKMKKREKALHMERLFDKADSLRSDYKLTAEQIAAIDSWTPEGFGRAA